MPEYQQSHMPSAEQLLAWWAERAHDMIIGLAPSGDWNAFCRPRNTNAPGSLNVCYGKTPHEVLKKAYCIDKGLINPEPVRS